MKKKAIEKIAYIGLDDTEKNKDVKYIGATKLEDIDNEKHLFLEIYKNEEEELKEPVIRIILTKKDFGNYEPESGKWNSKKIRPDYPYDPKLVWHPTSKWMTIQQKKNENILRGEEDLERIKTFTNTTPWKEGWWEYIKELEEEICYTRNTIARKRKNERRMNALKEREKNTPLLPEQKILREINKRVFGNQHFLFYKKKGSYAHIACTACGGATKARWKYPESFEQQFEKRTEEPREGERGHCPLCGAIGEYKCQGKHKKHIRKTTYAYIAQKGKKKGVIVRCLEVGKEWGFQAVNIDGEDVLYNAIEQLDGIEIMRATFEENKTVCLDFKKYDCYSGKDYWDDCNNAGIYHFSPNAGYVIKESFKNIKGTMFQYCEIENYLQKKNKVNLIDYFKCYQRTPQLEMLCKLGLYSIAENLIRYRYGIVIDENANNLHDFLGIRKEREKMLIAHKEDYIELLEGMKQERCLEQKWTEEQLLDVTCIGLSNNDLKQALKYMSIQKLINRIKKYSGCDNFSKVCGYSKYRIQEKARLYLDYLNMREEQGYDMTDSIIIAPKNLEEAHNKMVFETEKEELEKRIKEVNSHYLDIRSNYKKIAKKYSYKSDEYMIRPARSAAEIVIEGRMLHHCVGRNEYLERHNKGKSFILFLRSTKTPNVPFVTVEINRDRILQWYGAYDKKPNKKEIQEWLDEYVLKHLKRQELKKNIA